MSIFFGVTPDQMVDPAHACDRPALLHLAHSWGGGIERWVRDYAAADADHWNLLLRSRTWRNAAGVRLELVDLVADDVLLAWELDPAIPDCTAAHPQYRRILDDIVSGFGVEAVIVSSLIGHALDAFDSGRPTVVVLHDLFPFCPALFGWFGQACVRCERADLARCRGANPLHLFWYHDDPDHWPALRAAYAERLQADAVRIAAPGRWLHQRYAALFPVLRDRPWEEIPHGLGALPQRPARRPPGDAAAATRLRVLVPGRLAPHKGLQLFSELVGELAGFAEVQLLGCGDFGLPFRELEHVEVIADYDNPALGELVQAFAPDCALLLSVLPESYSYTLSEMTALGVPVVATRLGAFAERIEDGCDGFLVEPAAGSVLQRLRQLAQDRDALRRVAARLETLSVPTAAAMVARYRALLGLDRPDRGDGPRPRPLAAAMVRAAAERRFLRDEWRRLERKVGRLEDDLAGVEARAQAQERRADAQQTRADAERARADAQQARAETLTGLHAAQSARADGLAVRLAEAEAARDAILASTSWRMTRPLRAVSGLLRRDGEPPVPAQGAAPVASAQAPAPPPASAAAGPPARPAAPPAVAAAGPAAAPPSALIRVRRGDVLAWAYADRLRRALTPAGDELPEPQATALTAGFALVVEVAGAPGGPTTLACFDGLAGAPDAAAGALVDRLDGVLLPTAAAAARFRACWPQARARLIPVRPPWPDARGADPGPQALRVQMRRRLGLPDRARLVLGIGSLSAEAGLVRFARLATATCARRTDVRFVWLGARDAEWERLHWLEVGLPAALHQLFLIADRGFGDWFGAADAYVGCREAGVFDGGAVEALAAGLPVAVGSRSALPEVLHAAGCDRLVAEARGPALVDWLSARLDPGRPAAAPDSGLAQRARVCWEAGDAVPDLVRAGREALGGEGAGRHRSGG